MSLLLVRVCLCACVSNEDGFTATNSHLCETMNIRVWSTSINIVWGLASRWRIPRGGALPPASPSQLFFLNFLDFILQHNTRALACFIRWRHSRMHIQIYHVLHGPQHLCVGFLASKVQSFTIELHFVLLESACFEWIPDG